jgi:hypothetical protein
VEGAVAQDETVDHLANLGGQVEEAEGLAAAVGAGWRVAVSVC